MSDQSIPARPRVALVFGEADSAGHLRDAVSDHVEIVYASSAADFDVARLAGARATAALVNLDDCASLEAVETRLQEAGVAVVFNDPEISSKLEGWAQARWLRHLTAKLRGSSDFDPPRPAVSAVAAAAESSDSPEAGSLIASGADDAQPIADRPLSPAEIESMTADFGAPPARLAMAPAGVDAALAQFPISVDAANADEPMAQAGNAAPAPADMTTAMDAAGARPEAGDEHGDAGMLDVDTETLSALIDARLAAAGEPAQDAPEVWRVADGGAVSAVVLPSVAQEPAAAALADAVQPAAAVDDADVLKGLPSLDDWQLVDPEAPVAPVAGAKRDERDLSGLSIDFAGLELVPMDSAGTVERKPEPIERWMHAGEGKAGAGAPLKPEAPGAGGDQT